MRSPVVWRPAGCSRSLASALSEPTLQAFAGLDPTGVRLKGKALTVAHLREYLVKAVKAADRAGVKIVGRMPSKRADLIEVAGWVAAMVHGAGIELGVDAYQGIALERITVEPSVNAYKVVRYSAAGAFVYTEQTGLTLDAACALAGRVSASGTFSLIA
jgi:hypothetical protein